MADYCHQCSIHWFERDYRDLAGISTPEDTAQGRFVSVICEGCGFVLVDHNGVCQGGESCMENHQTEKS